jgi:Plasmid pRiA4b ORF-3-like protein
MKNPSPTPFKRLILRAVLNDVSPIVARVFSISDDVEVTELHDVFLSMLGWQHDLGFIIRVHGQEFNSYQRRSRGKRLRDFQLRRQEKFLYICNTLDLWEWEIRVLDIQEGNPDKRDSECLEGRGAAPPEHCGGARGYRLMLKRQAAGPQISDPTTIAASMKLLAQVYSEETDIDWQFFEEVVTRGWKRVEERLERTGLLTPTRFSRKEANERLASLMQQRRWWR